MALELRWRRSCTGLEKLTQWQMHCHKAHMDQLQFRDLGFKCLYWAATFIQAEPELSLYWVPSQVNSERWETVRDDVFPGSLRMKITHARFQCRSPSLWWLMVRYYCWLQIQSTSTSCGPEASTPADPRWEPSWPHRCSLPECSIVSCILSQYKSLISWSCLSLRMKYRYILVFQDYLTKWPMVYPMPDQKFERIAKLLVDEVIRSRSHSLRSWHILVPSDDRPLGTFGGE